MDQDADDLVGRYPLADALDHEILMHRDAHFGGHFPTMLAYYQQEGKGIQPEFEIEKIEQLANLEAELKQNLATLFLVVPEIEKVAEAREAYRRLKSIYEVSNPKNRISQLIADLILTEDVEAEAEIQAIVHEKAKIVPALIDILRNEQFYDPLFPGYGLAPYLAVKCLELIGDKRAIISLFEALGQGDFFVDDQIIKALQVIGEPAKEFLLRVVAGHPINEDNERAAIALIQFKEDESVAMTCLRLLHDPTVQQDLCLSTYLVLACEGLRAFAKRQEFIRLSQDQHFPLQLREDMKGIIQAWQKI